VWEDEHDPALWSRATRQAAARHSTLRLLEDNALHRGPTPWSDCRAYGAGRADQRPRLHSLAPRLAQGDTVVADNLGSHKVAGCARRFGEPSAHHSTATAQPNANTTSTTADTDTLREMALKMVGRYAAVSAAALHNAICPIGAQMKWDSAGK